MAESTERQTRFRGEGRPKRRLSPSPPAKPATTRSHTAKTSTPIAKPSSTKIRTLSGSTPAKEASSTSKRGQYKDGRAHPSEEEEPEIALPTPEYQSHLQSGNLDLVLQHARQKWLVDGVFDKYWTKYSRKKQEDVGSGKESMTKLSGECTMIIEPHSFKVTLFSVRSPSNTHGQNAIATQGVQQANPASPRVQAQPNQPPLRPYPPAQQPAPSSHSPSAVPSGHGPSDAQPRTNAAPSLSPRSTGASGNVGRAPAGVPNSDPVIQMLASKAATDTDLKSLMKVVAHGQATQEQLTVFQRHIDQLNGIISAKKKQLPANGPEHPGSGPPVELAGYSTTPEMSPAPQSSATGSYPASSHAGKPDSQVPLYYQPQTSFVKPKVPASSKTVLSAVVFEFTEANGIRYLFPRKSILEYLHGSLEVLVSFLVVRDGKSGVEGKPTDRQYYAPVNLKLIADSPRLLDVLSKIVAPQEEVREHMLEVMEKGELAEETYLASQLPDKEGTNGKKTNGRTAVPAHASKAPYEAPNSLIPLLDLRNEMP